MFVPPNVFLSPDRMTITGNVATNALEQATSTGFHFIEVHAPTMGVSLVSLLAMGALIFFLYKCCNCCCMRGGDVLLRRMEPASSVQMQDMSRAAPAQSAPSPPPAPAPAPVVIPMPMHMPMSMHMPNSPFSPLSFDFQQHRQAALALQYQEPPRIMELSEPPRVSRPRKRQDTIICTEPRRNQTTNQATQATPASPPSPALSLRSQFE